MSDGVVDFAARVRHLLDAMKIEQRSLAQSIGMSESSLSRALGGSRALKAIELARIAEALQVPIDSLLSDTPVIEPKIAARRSSGDNAGLNKALERVSTFVEVHKLLGDPGDRPAPVDHAALSGSMWQQGHELAARAWASGSLDLLPLQLEDLAHLISTQFDVEVAIEPTPAGLDGLSCVHGNLRLAFVSSSTAPVRQRWTLAHELGHLLAGDSQEMRVDERVFDNKSPDETRANAFAAAFLMPADRLKADFASMQPGELLHKYGVSQQALVYRLHNVGAINAASRDLLLRSPDAFEGSVKSSALSSRGAQLFPKNMSIRVIDAYLAGTLGVRSVAAFMDMPVDELLARLKPDEQEAEVLRYDGETVEA